MNVTDDDLVSSYFRPITNFVGISDTKVDRSMALSVDRPMSGTSRRPGELEVILERKTMSSDWKGVAEITNDEYDGFFAFKLTLYRSREIDDVRKDRNEEDLEVLHMIGATKYPDIHSLGEQLDYKPSAASLPKCLKVDLMPLGRTAADISIQLTLTRNCQSWDQLTSVAAIVAIYGIRVAQVMAIDLMTADGSLIFGDRLIRRGSKAESLALMTELNRPVDLDYLQIKTFKLVIARGHDAAHGLRSLRILKDQN